MTTTAPSDDLETTAERDPFAPPPESSKTLSGTKKPARPPRRPVPFAVRLLSWFLGALAVASLGLVAYLLFITPLQQHNDQERLADTFREQVALATAPTGGYIDPGEPVAQLVIPGLGLDQVVVQGTSAGDLQAGPGHLRNTVLPGQAGNAVIYGRSAMFGAPFEKIAELHAGDVVSVTTGQGSFGYRVRGVRRPGDPVPPALAKGAGRLTLVTSQGSNMVRHNDIVLVDADLTDQPQSTPSGQPSLIPPTEQAMATNAGAANIQLVIWLQALGLVLAGMVWGRHRWGRSEALVVGVPVAVAIVWNIWETVAQLLPNLL